jgi:hypothetical protein
MILSCEGAPFGYIFADQLCAEFVLANDSYCIDSCWDGVCQTAYDNCLGVFGCMDDYACNYDPMADTDDGSCYYGDICGDCEGFGTVIGCMDDYACNYDPMADTECNIADLCSYPGCTDEDACNYELWSGCDDGSCIYEDICGDCGGAGTVLGCMDDDACNYDPMANTECNIADLCSYPGCTDELACNYNFWSGCDDGSCNFDCCTCNNPEACNYDADPDCIDNDACLFYDACDVCGGPGNMAGCTNSMACNYDSSADCDDGSCLSWDECGNCGGSEMAGCIDLIACNYDSEAGCDDGSCIYFDECGNCGGTDTSGCTDPEACNYNAGADCDDSSCLFDGCTDGCIDFNACNYDSEADVDNGSCDYSCLGCTDDTACNYDASSTIDDDSCTYPGCNNINACNYDALAGCNDGNCTLIGDSCDDGDSDTVNDLIQDDCGCEGEILNTQGCTDPDACNFDSNATDDDGTCEYVELFAIVGNTTPDPLSSEDYFYSSTLGSSYAWEASNGAVISGQGTTSVTVVWGESGLATISVIETNEEGCEGDVVMEEFTIISTTVSELLEESLNVYPNPASSYLIIESDLLKQTGTQIKLIDSKGRLVIVDAMNDGNQLDVSNVASGVYFLRIISELKVESVRVIIQK